MSKNHRKFWLIGMFCLFVLAGCKQNDETKENVLALPVLEIDTATARVTRNFLGTIEGKVNVEIRPQVGGILEDIYIDEGDFVEAGKPLFKIQATPYQEALNNAIANEKVAAAKLEAAKIEVDRIKPLIEHQVGSEVRLKKAESEYRLAQASLEQATAAVATAKFNLSFTVINAPVSGYIGRIPKRVGNVVSLSEPITFLSDVAEVYVYFSISEADFLSFRKNTAKTADDPKDSILSGAQRPIEISLLLADGTPYPYKGTLDMVSGQVNRTTGALSMRATFKNRDKILRSGNSGTLKMDEFYPNVILIPQQAIASIQDKDFVMKLTEDNKVVRQIITIDGVSGDQYIVSGGLKKGDRIITEGFQKLKEGDVVSPLIFAAR